MERRAFSQALMAAGLATAARNLAAQTPAGGAKNVVLVHGLYADGSSWGPVVPRLQDAGLRVTCVQNPLTSFADDVECTRRALALQDGPTLLVGHSYGGMVISEAGTDPKVTGLVYVAGRAPDAGEDYGALVRQFPAAPAGAGLVWGADGYGYLTEQAFLRDFAGDLDPRQARVYFAAQKGPARAVTAARTTVAAWRGKPSWYAVCTQDRTIHPDLQRFMASRMKASTVELASSHVPMLSRPTEVALLILAAAQARPAG